MIAADGGSVAFRSHATNLVVGDGNGAADIFVRTLASGTTVRASLTFAGGQAAGASASGAAVPRPEDLPRRSFRRVRQPRHESRRR
jgi:hypothetical protein